MGRTTWSTVVRAFEGTAVADELRAELDGTSDPEDRWVLRIALEEGVAGDGPDAVDSASRLVDELAAADAPIELQVWARAVLAERAAARFDPRSVPVALDALALLPDEALVSPVASLGRARLRRLLAYLWLVMPGDNAAVSAAHHDQAMRDLERCGLDAHAAYTTQMHSALHVGLVGDDPVGRMARIEEAQAVLDEHGPGLRANGLVIVAGVAGLLGYQDRLRGALARLDAYIGEPGMEWTPEQADLITRLLSTFADLLDDDGPEARARLDAVIEDTRRTDRWLCVLALHTAAFAILNEGDLDGARAYWARAQAYPAPFVSIGYGHAVLPHRLAILGGDSGAVTPLKEVLGDLADAGRGRLAANQALRAAVDCRRVGDHAHADLLLSFALEHLGPPDRWAPIEAEVAALAAAQDDPAVREAVPGPTTEVRLLAPNIDVMVGGRPVALTPNVARLLAVLLAYPSPMTVDQLIERLWPESDPAAARRRLASALHRLRTSLGVGRQELVVRHGDALTVILPGHWRVDAVELRAARRAGHDERVAALVRSATGAVASVQLAYDEALTDARHALVADWLDAARHLCGRGVVDPVELAGPLAALDLDVADLAML